MTTLGNAKKPYSQRIKPPPHPNPRWAWIKTECGCLREYLQPVPVPGEVICCKHHGGTVVVAYGQSKEKMSSKIDYGRIWDGD